ncbi:unnamed protein product [Eruca vesicaria subsp. sativa]|uniref:NAC domain-containing protein n=1 Tax=Eruca vesicaria subsp. sativa TaxID=29727 RepID=A0ABC8M137_ERUVS|nr:unnamed protein product [Eruca vesicaria subsp. sativa]
MDGLKRSVEVIPDIYCFEPWDFPDKSIVKSETEWFFFCARGKKYPNGSQNNQVIGTKRTLVFHIGRAPKGQRTEWLTMHEYCMKGGVFMVNYSKVHFFFAVNHYIRGESWEKHLTEMAETAENLQVQTEQCQRDEIINLDEVMMIGKTPNEVPTLESASMAIRILPLPNMIDRQMASFLEERPSQEKKGKGNSGTEPLSSCFMGVYSIKSVN